MALLHLPKYQPAFAYIIIFMLLIAYVYHLSINYFIIATQIYVNPFPLLLKQSNVSPLALLRWNGVGLMLMVSIVSHCIITLSITHILLEISFLRFTVFLKHIKTQCSKCTSVQFRTHLGYSCDRLTGPRHDNLSDCMQKPS